MLGGLDKKRDFLVELLEKSRFTMGVNELLCLFSISVTFLYDKMIDPTVTLYMI